MNRRELLTGLVGAAVMPLCPTKRVTNAVVVSPGVNISVVGAKLISYHESGVEVAYVDIKGVMHIVDLKPEV